MKKAFTLVEVMLSVAILSIALVLILQALAHSLNILRISKDNLKATLAAENMMAQMQIKAKEDWDSFASGLSDDFDFENLECEWKAQVSPFTWYEGDSFEGEEDVLSKVSASLSWREGKREGVVLLDTLMRRYEQE